MSEPLLIVFARYPEPGKVKTRLAGEIGQRSACALYRTCLERTLRAVRSWSRSRCGAARLYMAEAAGGAWECWPGAQWDVRIQRRGDLGRRMATALEDGFRDGYCPVLCLGTDAPRLKVRHIRQAVRKLRRSDVVIGPARDGGYYLIGLRRACPSLFAGIPWSTPEVLASTEAAAGGASLSVSEIAMLHDLDTVADLQGGAGRTSVVIPTLGEARRISEVVQMAWDMGAYEVIVSDGESTDGTAERARATGAHVVRGPAGRGLQLNAGARVATGETLWFIHADCRLDPLALWEMGRALEDPAVVGGAFELRIDHPALWLRVLEATTNLRTRFLQRPYGDQAMFVRREVFERVGGFPDWPLMEDVELGRRMRHAGKLVTLALPATVSARRWQSGGVMRTYATMKLVQLGNALGASPETLARLYGRGRRSG